MTAKKCSCRSVWCSICWPRWGKLHFEERLQTFDYRRVRHIVVSCDRNLFKDGREAYIEVGKKRSIGEMVKNFVRTDGVDIEDCVWTLQFHRDGFPHWHIIILVKKEGAAGMIGRKTIKARWPHGMWVRETHYESEGHWKNLVGYFNRHGYFEGAEGYQGKLPEWALKSHMKVKRWDGMQNATFDKKKMLRMTQDKTSPLTLHLTPNHLYVEDQLTNEERLQSCGATSMIEVRKIEYTNITPSMDYTTKGHVIYYDKTEQNIRYDILKKSFPWRYVEGQGLTIEVGCEDDVRKFFHKLRSLSGIVPDAIKGGSEESEGSGERPPLPSLNGEGALNRAADYGQTSA